MIAREHQAPKSRDLTNPMSRCRYGRRQRRRTCNFPAIADAVNAVFQASFFLHFASKIEEMPLVREHPSSWWDILT